MDAVLGGEASPEERETLDRMLIANPALREMVEARRRLFRTLRRVRAEEPPADLRDSIREAVRREAAEAPQRLESDVSPGPWVRLFHPSRRRSQMSNKKWILGAATAVAVVVAYLAIRNPNPGSNAQGTIGAANRYQSQQISGADVKLDNQQVANFIQSDAFRKLAASPAFREAAKSDAFARLVGDDKLRDASAKYDLAKILDNAHVVDLLKSETFAKAMTDARIAEGLRAADLGRLIDSAHLADLLKLDALRDVAAKADFIKVANDAAKVDALSMADLSKIVDGYKGLASSDAWRALESNKYFADAVSAGFMDLFRSPEGAAFAVDGLRQMVDAGHLAEALRMDGFKSMMDGLNADTFASVVDLARAPDMLSVLSDASYRDAAAHAELSAVADAGFVDALAKMPE